MENILIYDLALPCENDDVEALKRVFHKHYEEMCKGKEHTPLDIGVIENYLGMGKRVQCYGRIFVSEGCELS